MDWIEENGARYATLGTIDSSRGGTVYAPASLNTKGAWNRLVITPFDANEVTFGLCPGGPTNNIPMLLDVARGTIGSEQIFVNNIGCQIGRHPAPFFHFPVPVETRAGEVISFRAQSASATAQFLQITTTFAQKGFPHTPGSQIYTYGAATSASTGTEVVCGTNAKGAWAQFVASTTIVTKNILIVLADRPAGNFNNGDYLYDVGIGAAGAEKIKIPDLRYRTQSADQHMMPKVLGPLPCAIPAGSRIAMRGQTNDPARDAFFIIYAFN